MCLFMSSRVTIMGNLLAPHAAKNAFEDDILILHLDLEECINHYKSQRLFDSVTRRLQSILLSNIRFI